MFCSEVFPEVAAAMPELVLSTGLLLVDISWSDSLNNPKLCSDDKVELDEADMVAGVSGSLLIVFGSMLSASVSGLGLPALVLFNVEYEFANVFEEELPVNEVSPVAVVSAPNLMLLASELIAVELFI